MKTRYLTLTLALAAAVAAAPLFAGAKERGSSGGRSGGGRSGGAISRHSGGSRSAPSGHSGLTGRRSGRSGAGHYSGRSDHRGRSIHRGRGGHYYSRSYRYYGRPYSWSWGWYPFGYYYDGWYPGYYGYGGWGPRSYHVRLGHSGSVRLQVEPEDAEVYVDGGYAGQVDEFNGVFQRLHLRPGRHELMFKAEGFKTHRLRAYVPVDGTLRIRFRMEPGTTSEETASVVGQPETQEALEGSEAEAQGATALAERDDDEDDDSERAEAEAAPEAAEVKLEVQPADAAVYIDGKFVGSADDVADLELAPGRHRIEVVRPGHATFEKDIEVAAGRRLQLKISLDRTTSS